MLKKPLFFSFRFLLPFAAVLILLGGFFFYYFLIISRQESSLNLRAFRSLASVSGQLRDLVVNYGEVLHVADQNRDSKGEIIHEVQDFLTAQVPDLKLDVPPDSSKVIFAEDGNYLQLSHGKLRANFRINTALEPLLNETPYELFDDVLLTDANGVVLYQTQRSGVVATDLSSVLTALPPDSRKSKSDADATKSDDKKKEHTSENKRGNSTEAAEPAKTEAEGARASAYAAMTESSNLATVTLAGTDYRAYLVPVALTLEEGNGDASRGQAETRENMRLVLCGLMRQTAFREETRSVPGVALTTLILAMDPGDCCSMARA